MIRAVLDTNTVVSGFGWEDSPPAKIVDLALDGRFVLVTTPPLLKELNRVLRYAKLAEIFEDPGRIVSLVESVAVVISPPQRISVVRDESDNRLLEAARSSAADYLVTGDRELLKLGRFDDTVIVSAREFLDAIDEHG